MLEADFQRTYAIDLRHLVFRELIGVRRLAALLYGLPPDAAVWRQEQFTPTEELLATIAERSDAWNQTLMQAFLGHKKIESPGVVEIPRPQPLHAMGERRVETDVRRIAEWFRQVA